VPIRQILAGVAALPIAAPRSHTAWVALALLGMGWNFAFIGATAMVTQCHRPSERNKVQAVNDFLVFGAMAIGSFSSGQILANFGWTAVNEVGLPIVITAGALLAWVTLARRRRVAV
jgi:predicted MFS family arabinose efflux permease